MEEEQELVGRQFNSFEELELTFGLSRLCEKHIAIASYINSWVYAILRNGTELARNIPQDAITRNDRF